MTVAKVGSICSMDAAGGSKVVSDGGEGGSPSSGGREEGSSVVEKKNVIMDSSITNTKATAATDSVTEEEDVARGNAIGSESPPVDDVEENSEGMLGANERNGESDPTSKTNIARNRLDVSEASDRSETLTSNKLDVSEASDKSEIQSDKIKSQRRRRRHRSSKSRSQRKFDASFTSTKSEQRSKSRGISKSRSQRKVDASFTSTKSERRSKSRSRKGRDHRSVSRHKLSASGTSTKSSRSSSRRRGRKKDERKLGASGTSTKSSGSSRSSRRHRGQKTDEGDSAVVEQKMVASAKEKENRQLYGQQNLLEPPYDILVAGNADDPGEDAKKMNEEVTPIKMSAMPAPEESSDDESGADEPAPDDAPPKPPVGGVRSSIIWLLEVANVLRKEDEEREEERRRTQRISITSIIVPRWVAATSNSAKQQHQDPMEHKMQMLQRSVTQGDESNRRQHDYSQCFDCNTELTPREGGFFGLKKKKNRHRSCTTCSRQICQKCASNQCLVPFKEYDRDPLPLKKSSIRSYCKVCFHQASTLDHRKMYDTVMPDQNKKNITIVWVHGGGGSRAMFRPHASALAHMGYYSILLDLPGHGARADQAFTLESCVDAVRHVLDARCGRSSRIVYVGASLGAYVGFHILGQLKDRFAGAILMDCGRNFGPDCSFRARASLWSLRKRSERRSNETMMGGMIRTIERSKADYHLTECYFADGVLFQQCPAWVNCMRAVTPAEIIPTLDVPILFINGSKDNRDSEDRWLDLCNDKGKSSLFIYHGDRFFCHDSRYVEDLGLRLDAFIRGLGLEEFVPCRTKRSRRVAI